MIKGDIGNLVKSSSLILVVFFLALPLGGCGASADSSSPSAVVKKYFAAIKQGDVETLKEIPSPHWFNTANSPIFIGAARTGLKERGEIKGCSPTFYGDNVIVQVTFEKGESTIGNVIYAGLAKIEGKWIIETVVPEVRKDIVVQMYVKRAEENSVEESTEQLPGIE